MKAKKLISILLSAVMLLSCIAGLDFSAYALSSSGQCGDNVTYTYDSSNGRLVISGTGDMYDYYSYNGSPFYNSSIRSVVIESGVTSIGNNAFRYCDYLQSVTIGDDVKTIGSYAFYYCDELQNVIIGNSVETIGECAFQFCYDLYISTIDLSRVDFSSSSFYGVGGFKDIYINSSSDLSVVANKLGDKRITNFHFNSDSSYLDYQIYWQITNFIIGNNANENSVMQWLDNYHFESIDVEPDCENYINESDNIYSGDYSKLYYIKPETVFLEIPEQTEFIYANLNKLDDLLYIVVDDNNKAFKTKLGVLYNYYGTELIKYPPKKSGSSYTIPNGVKVISNYAFKSPANLKTVTVPNSVIDLNRYSFTMSNENEYTVKAEVGTYAYNFLTQVDSSVKPSLSSKVNSAAITLLEDAETVAPFIDVYYNNTITYRFTPSSTATYYYNGARIHEDEDIVYNSNSESKPKKLFIYDENGEFLYQFYYFDELKFDLEAGKTYYLSMEFPTYYEDTSDFMFTISTSEIAVKEIYREGLYYRLDPITQTAAVVGPASDHPYYDILEVVNGYPVTSIDDYAFNSCFALKRVTIPSTVAHIGDGAFIKNKDLSLVFNDNDNFVFVNGVLYNADMTELIWYPSSLTETEFIVPNTVEVIRPYAISDNSNLEIIKLNDGLKHIGDYAITSATIENIPSTVETIGIGASGICDDEDSVFIIPETVKEFGFSNGYYTYIFESAETMILASDEDLNTKNYKVTYIANSDSFAHDFAKRNSRYIDFVDIDFYNNPQVPVEGCEHKITRTISNPATCESNGFELVVCAACGKYMSMTVVDALGHSYSENVISPTCINIGYTNYTCSNCGDSYTGAFTPMIEHKLVDSVVKEASCTENGQISIICEMCGYGFGRYIVPATGHNFVSNEDYCTNGCGTMNSGACAHNYVAVERVEPTCQRSGKIVYECELCGASYRTITPIADHAYVENVVPSTPNTQGYTKFTCPVCEYAYVGDITPYATDKSALRAAIQTSEFFDINGFTESSFDDMQSMVTVCENLIDEDAPQVEIDNSIASLLEAEYSLVAYLNISVSSATSQPTVTYDDATYTDTDYSILYGTRVDLSAPEVEGYIFTGWFETVSKRTVSTENDYSFFVSTNLSLEAMYVPAASATLTFANESGQIVKTVTKSTDSWSRVNSIAPIEPAVPYSFAHINGAWDYDNSAVLSRLTSGEDVIIVAVYDIERELDILLPENDSEFAPAATLRFEHSDEYNKGSFIMDANIPEACNVNSIGVAFCYGKDNFDPTKMLLTLNNKNVVSQFDANQLESLYIVNTKTTGRNWAAVGYITYFNQDGTLVTCYSNQVNIINNEWIK